MKRFQKELLGVVVSGALLFSAQAVGITNTSDTANDILQSAPVYRTAGVEYVR